MKHAGKVTIVSSCAQVFMVDTLQTETTPTLIYAEHDDRHHVQLTRSKDDTLIMINSNSKAASEARSGLSKTNFVSRLHL